MIEEHVIATYGAKDYNDPIVGAVLKWDVRFMELAKHVALWSKDPSTKVGAVVVRDRHVLGTGYNGFPPGVDDSAERLNDRPTKYALVQHAERNAIHNAMEEGHSVRGATIYVWPTLMIPNACNECMKSIVTVGISTLVGYSSEKLSDRWQEQGNNSLILAKEGGVAMYLIQQPWWETHDWRTAEIHVKEHPYEPVHSSN